MKRATAAGAIVVAGMISAAAMLYQAVPVDEIAPTDRYDIHFRKYGKRYFSVLSDWRWFKAQSMAESSMRSDAVSHRGAVGIMQILPDTFAEATGYRSILPITDPKWNVAVGIAFTRHLYDRWMEWVPPEQRLKFTLASYNAGLKRMLSVKRRAARNGEDEDHWVSVAPYAPKETRRYVERIHHLMGRE